MMNRSMRCMIAAGAFAAGLALSAHEATATVFNTTPSWDGNTSFNSWGSVHSGATPTYGQTFIAPSANVLQNFTFYLNGLGSGATTTFQADVYAWSGNLINGNYPQGATGPALFTSANMSITDNGTFQPVTIDIAGGLTLTPGDDYVALLTTSDPASIAANASDTSFWVWGAIWQSVANDGGGGGNYDYNTTSNQLNSTSWNDACECNYDLAWTANFTSGNAVPEPSTWLVFSTGLLGFGYYKLSRRREIFGST